MEYKLKKLQNFLQTQWLSHSLALGIRRDQWAFSSMENRYFDSNARYLFQYVYQYLPEIIPVYVMNDPVRRRSLQEQYPRAKIVDTNTRQGIRTVLESGVWFTSAGLPVYGTGLAKDRIVANLWHGVPLKKILLAQKRHSILYRLCFSRIFSRNYTWVITTSSHLIPLMQRSFGVGREQVKVWGQPRNDGLFGGRKAREVLGEIYHTLPDFTKAVLYAPTHHDKNPVRLFPFQDFDPGKLAGFLEQEQILLCVRTHAYEKEHASLPDSPRILWLDKERAEDVMEVLDVFDLLVTDYSSIYIDFLLTGRPMMFLPYDKEEYLAGRGLNFPYGRVTPGPKPKTFQDFCVQLRELLGGKDAYVERRRKANLFFNEIQEPCCGQICSKVLDHIRDMQE